MKTTDQKKTEFELFEDIEDNTLSKVEIEDGPFSMLDLSVHGKDEWGFEIGAVNHEAKDMTLMETGSPSMSLAWSNDTTTGEWEEVRANDSKMHEHLEKPAAQSTGTPPLEGGAPSACMSTPSQETADGQTLLDGVPQPQWSRAEALERYRRKRANRCFKKKIRYQCRKRIASVRPRVGGRFARTNEMFGSCVSLNALAAT